MVIIFYSYCSVNYCNAKYCLCREEMQIHCLSTLGRIQLGAPLSKVCYVFSICVHTLKRFGSHICFFSLFQISEIYLFVMGVFCLGSFYCSF